MVLQTERLKVDMVLLQRFWSRNSMQVITLVIALLISTGTPFEAIARVMTSTILRATPTNYPDQTNIEKVARNAVILAGKIILEGSGTIDLLLDTKSKIGSRDIVTECDINSQISIMNTISTAYSTHKFLGEEDIAPGREAATQALKDKMEEEHLWIIDPIDGTTNFAHGSPLCGVILAYASKGNK